MNSGCKVAVVGLLFSTLAGTAHASTLIFTYYTQLAAKGAPIKASGNIAVQHTIGNIYKIIDASGSVDGSEITGINKNSAPALFSDAMGRLTGENNAAVSFYTLSGVTYNFGFGIATSSSGDVSFGRFDVSSVPLPASAPMFGAALIALAGFGYKAKRKTSKTAA